MNCIEFTIIPIYFKIHIYFPKSNPPELNNEGRGKKNVKMYLIEQEQIHEHKLRKTNEHFSYNIHEHSQGVRKERVPKIKTLTLMIK